LRLNVVQVVLAVLFVPGPVLIRDHIDRRSAFHEAGFDEGYHFVLVEIVEDVMHFQAISDEGQTVDAGRIPRRAEERTASMSEVTSAPSL
jgi:hypothetical protein